MAFARLLRVNQAAVVSRLTFACPPLPATALTPVTRSQSLIRARPIHVSPPSSINPVFGLVPFAWKLVASTWNAGRKLLADKSVRLLPPEVPSNGQPVSTKVQQLKTKFTVLQKNNPGAAVTVYARGPRPLTNLLAREFGDQHFHIRKRKWSQVLQNRKQVVATLDARNKTEFKDDYATLAAELTETTTTAAERNELEKAPLNFLENEVEKALRKRKGWLLIIRNLGCRGNTELSALWPQPGTKDWGEGLVLVTTSSSDVGDTDNPAADELKIGELPATDEDDSSSWEETTRSTDSKSLRTERKELSDDSTSNQEMMHGEHSQTPKNQDGPAVEATYSKLLGLLVVCVSVVVLAAYAIREILKSTSLTSYTDSLRDYYDAVFKPGPLVRYARYLKSRYSTSRVFQDDKSPLTSSNKYIDLAMVKWKRVNRAESDAFTKATLRGDIDQIIRKKEPIEFEDILKPNPNEKLRFVLVEGAPGVGKSTFAWELCKRWDEVEALKKYSLVVHVRLRDECIQKATSLTEFFYHSNTSLQEEVIKEVEAREGKGVLFVLDGAHDVPGRIRRNSSSLFHQIISGSILPEAAVLVTSRPSASADLVSISQPQKHIEILGFTREQISQYAESTLDPELVADFKKYISTPSIEGTLYVPLNLAMVVRVFMENQTQDKPIPTTLTELYSNLTTIRLQQYLHSMNLAEDLHDLPQTIEEFPETVRRPFLALAEMAFEGIRDQHFTFSKLPEGSEPLDFTTLSPELYIGKRLHNFRHRTVQEYLAAFYISQLPPKKRKELFQKHHSQPHMKIVWRFVAGLTQFRDIGWDVVKSNIHVSPFLVQCLYESQDREACKSALGSGEVSLQTYGTQYQYPTVALTPSDSFALGYCIAHSKCTWKLRLAYQGLGHELLEMLALGVKSAPKVSGSIHTLSLWGVPLTEKDAAHLKALPLAGIQNLTMLKSTLDDVTVGHLVREILPAMDALKVLKIGPFKCGSEVATRLLALPQATNLEVLYLGGLCLGPDDIGKLGELVAPSTGKLKVLGIGSEKMSAEAVEEMITTFLAPSSLQCLHFFETDLHSSMDRFTELLEKNTNLKDLIFARCKISGSDAKRLAEALSKHTTLQSFRHSQIGPEGAVAFAEMLRVNRSLKLLDVVDPSIGVEGARALIDALKDNRTLEKLWLHKEHQQRFSSSDLDPRIKWAG